MNINNKNKMQQQNKTLCPSKTEGNCKYKQNVLLRKILVSISIFIYRVIFFDIFFVIFFLTSKMKVLSNSWRDQTNYFSKPVIYKYN